ncbi:hypothetical protein BDN71DRAFT_1458153 [Pleurotus eryngii]|uniref:Uncharacterized protein n=1 Tax=Pleurotus eryngii TaxID=5323 RepID=A0A9P6D0M1_PLEER|nr:hypothetical protein BDN71DRAFT_1458153 [Pleurotus eryngii]
MEGNSVHQESVDQEVGYAGGVEAHEDNRPLLPVQQKGVRTAVVASLEYSGLLRKPDCGSN